MVRGNNIKMNKLELRQLLQEGEGYKIEFKEAMSNLDKELVAFANSSGGRIFIGVRDDKTINGINKVIKRVGSARGGHWEVL